MEIMEIMEIWDAAKYLMIGSFFLSNEFVFVYLANP